MIQTLSFFGALIFLFTFFLLQVGIMKATDKFYIISNIVGAASLSVVALDTQQWGFLLLDGVMTIVGVVSLLKGIRNDQEAD